MTHATDAVRVSPRTFLSRTTLLLVAGALATVSLLVLAPARAQAADLCGSSAFGPLASSSFQGGDGDQCDSTGPSGTKDWQTLASDFGAGEPGITVVDNDAAPYSILGTGAKEEEPRDWDFVTNPLPNAKTNLLTAWGYPDPQVGHLFFYLAAASQEATGSTNLNIELNKNDPSQTFISDAPASEPVIKRSLNDVLLQFDWTGGGGAKLIMCRWKPTFPLQPWLEGTWGNVADPCRNLTAAPVQAQAAENTTAITNFLPNAGTTLQAQQFVEAAVDLTAALNLGGVGQPKCQDFGAFSMRTRTSPSLDASLKDVIGPYPVSISNCGRVIIRKETDPATAGTPDFDFTSLGFDLTTVEGSPDTTPTAFSIGHGESETIKLVEPGTNYSITEVASNLQSQAAAQGYDLVDITCSETGAVSNTPSVKDVPNRTVNLKVDAGETIDCTFKNRKRASITVTKDAVPNDAQDFSFTADGAGLSNFSLDDDSNVTLPNSKTFANLTSLGKKYITEDGGVSGWDLTNIKSCTGDSELVIGRFQGSPATFTNGGSDGFDQGDTTIEIDLDAGENVACTFENSKRASVVVRKDAAPDHPQDFAFATQGTGLSGFSLDDDGDGTLPSSTGTSFTSLSSFGKKLVTETPAANWTLSGIACTGSATVRYGQLDGSNTFVDGANGGAFGSGDTTAEIDVQPGTTADCVFTNTAAPASLTVTKDAVPDHPQDFAFAQDGLSGGATFDLDDDGDNTNALSNQKAYSSVTAFGKKLITENPASNWTLDDIACSGATVRYGTVDSGGTFVPSATPTTFTAGDTTAEVDLQPGTTATCTFTNEAAPASLTVIKDAAPNDAQDFGFKQTGLAGGATFDLDDDGDNANALSNQKAYSGVTAFGKKLITETPASNWTLSKIECSGATVRYGTVDSGGTFVPSATPTTFAAGDTTAEVDLQPGATATCTFTNEATPASLTVTKDAAPNHAQDFAFAQDGLSGGATFDLDDDGDNTNALSNSKAYSNITAFGKKLITETPASNWTLDDIACSGATARYGTLDSNGDFVPSATPTTFTPDDTTAEVDLQPGSAATCTFTNEAAPASLTVTKDAAPDHAQDFTFKQTGLSGGATFDLDDDGDNTNALSNSKAYTSVTAFGKKLITETPASNWTLDDIACSGATVRYGTVDTSGTFVPSATPTTFTAGDTTAEVDLQPGTVATCAFTNEAAPASLAVTKDAAPNHPQDFTFAQDGLAGGATFDLDDDGDNTNALSNSKAYSGVTAFGKKLVTETPASNWTLDDIACSGATVRYGGLDSNGDFVPSATPSTFSAGDTTAELDLQPGSAATCTFTNEAAPASLTVTKDADPNHAQDFTFKQAGLAGGATFDLDDDGDNTNALSNQKSYSGVTAFGKKLITENPASSWTLSKIECAGATVRYGTLDSNGDFVPSATPTAFSSNDTTAEIDLQPGTAASCTFTNAAAPASLTVTKDAAPNHSQDFTFAQKGLAGGATFDLDDDGDNTNALSNSKAYSGVTAFGKKLITETPASNWTLDDIACSGATVRYGTLDSNGDFVPSATPTTFALGDTTAEMDLQPGTTATCTFTNEAAPASLTVTKDAAPNHAQDFAFKQTGLSGAATFDLDDDGDNTNALSNAKSYANVTAFGKKLITETPATNWTLSKIECSGATVRYGTVDSSGTFVPSATPTTFSAGDTTAEVDLQPGTTATCTFTNEAAPASLTVTKDADPDHAQDFTFKQTGLSGGATFDLDDDGDNTNALSNQKAYSSVTAFGKKLITENPASNWTLDDIACSGATVRYGTVDSGGTFVPSATPTTFTAGDTTAEVDLQPGTTAGCTFINTAAPASLTVTKDADPNHAQDFTFKQTGLAGGATFDLDDDGDNTNALSNQKAYSNVTAFGKKLITETPASNWTLDDIACSGATVRYGSVDSGGAFVPSATPTAFSAGDTTAEVDVQPGTTATCTFTNEAAPASLTVTKDADPNHAQDFAFKQTGLAGGATFNLDDDSDGTLSNTKSYSNVSDFGTKLITETAASNWTLSKIECSGATVRYGTVDSSGTFVASATPTAFSAGDTTAEIDLQPGSAASCTFTNAAAPASLTVTKDADPNHAQDFGFKQTGLAGGATFDLDDDGDNTNALSNSKAYANVTAFGKKLITETPASNWTLDDIACSGATVRYGTVDSGGSFVPSATPTTFTAGDTTAEVDLQPGTTASCTFTNTAAPASLTVTKDAAPDHAQDFAFKQTGLSGGATFDLDDDGDNTNALADSKAYSNVTAFGKKLITETPASNWTLDDIDCSGATVRYGALDGNGDFVPSATPTTFTAGDTTAEIDLQPGTAATCTFTNEAAPASLTVTKEAAPDHAQDFTFKQDGLPGGATFDLDDDGDNTNALSNSKAYSGVTAFGKKLVTETPASNWTLDDIACSGATVRYGELDSNGDFVPSATPTTFSAGDTTVEVDLQPGTTATCTFTNEAAPASLTVTKDAAPDHAQDFTFKQTGLAGGATFDLDNDGDNTNALSNSKAYSNVTAFGKKLITETPAANWTLDDISCSGATVRFGALDSNGDFVPSATPTTFTAGDTTAEVDLQPGTAATCTFTNEAAPASLTVTKDAAPNHPQDFTFAQDGLGGASTFDLDDDGDNTNALSNAKAYSGVTAFGKKLITETPASNWALSKIECAGATVRYGTVDTSGAFVPSATPTTFAAGDTTAEVDLQPGTTAGCTFTNTAAPGIVVTVKDADPNHSQDFSFEQDGLTGENATFNLDDDSDATLDDAKTFDNRTDFGLKLITEKPVANWTLTKIECTATATFRIGKLDANGDFTLDGKTAGFEAGDTTVEIDLQPGKTANCTFTNTATPASLSIVKDADPDHPQDFGFAQDGLANESATFDLDDDSDGTLSNTKTYSGRTDFGKKVVREVGVTGWTLSNIVCTGDADVRIGKVIGGVFTLDGATTGFDAGDTAIEADLQPGKSAACTFTNQGRGTIEIAKQTAPDENDPNRTSFAFTTNPSIVLGAGFSLKDDDVHTIASVPANDAGGAAYEVTESAASGYRLTGVACASNGQADGDSTNAQNGAGLTSRVASIRVSPGQTVRCTFTNTKINSSTVLIKAGNEYAYHGDTVTYTFDVTNSGNGPLTNVAVSDDKCPNVTGPDKGSDGTPATLDPGETWKYTCSMTVGAHAAGEANPVVNTATVSATDEFGRPVGASDDHQTRILHPAIAIDKTGPATGIAGQPVAYSLVVTNPGDVTFDGGLVTIQDTQCEAPPALVSKGRGGGTDPSPATLDPGDSWTYSCTVRTTVGQTVVNNEATVSATDPNGRGVAARDTASTTLAQPVAARAQQLAAAGTARLTGATGCRPRTFTAIVRGRQIARVVWYVDNKKVKTARASQALRSFKLRVNPKKYKRGVHRIRARVTFTKASGTKPRNLRMAFQRCGAARRVLPRFTG